MENKNLVPNEEFYLLLPPKEQLKNALIKPEFFFIKKKKKRTPSQANKFSSSKWLKIITVFDVFYLVLGYFTDMLGIDDYIVFASMVLGGILYLIEKYGKLQLPEVCFFCVNQEFIQYHFETGVKVELLKFARLLGFSKPKTIHFKSIENIEIQFKGIKFKLKNGKTEKIELFFLGEPQILQIQEIAEITCKNRGIPVITSELAKAFKEKMKVEENER